MENMENNLPTCICACVCQVQDCALLVCDHCTSQEILVHTPRACCYCPGECLCIQYSGAMTSSIPPQISATCIRRLGRC